MDESWKRGKWQKQATKGHIVWLHLQDIQSRQIYIDRNQVSVCQGPVKARMGNDNSMVCGFHRMFWKYTEVVSGYQWLHNTVCMLSVTELCFIIVQMANLVMCILPKNIRILPGRPSLIDINPLIFWSPWHPDPFNYMRNFFRFKALTTATQVLVQSWEGPILKRNVVSFV